MFRGRHLMRTIKAWFAPLQPPIAKVQTWPLMWINRSSINSGSVGWRDATEAQQLVVDAIAGNGLIAIGSIVDEIGYLGTARRGKGYSSDEDRHASWHPAIVDRRHAARSGGLALDLGTLRQTHHGSWRTRAR